MEISTLLDEIAAYCGQNQIAESTFGRLAINDGKLMSRLRTGGRVTEQTCTRIRAFMRDNQQPLRKRTAGPQPGAKGWPAAQSVVPWLNPEAEKSFRFYDNRQKYLLFVTTSSEKWMVAERAAAELAHIRPHPPAVRLLDAGVGDGSVLARLMRAMHHRFATMPFYIVGKEISVENLRLTLEKMPDRFCEHPATVLVMTNMFYSEAPWLQSRAPEAAPVWHELALTGTTGHEFEQQITDLQSLLAANWQAHAGSKTGSPIYERPVVLVIYRKDYRFLLESILPRKGAVRADFDFVLASQPYRARASAEFKARAVIAPLVRALGPGGRLLGIHSHGDGPGLEIVRRIWPDENPFETDRHQVLREVKTALGASARNFNFQASSDAHSRFRYEMYTLPSEIGPNIGTSTLLAAWNAAVYVAQIEDHRLENVISHQDYLDATAEVLRKHGGLWFWDETYVISRRQEQD